MNGDDGEFALEQSELKLPENEQYVKDFYVDVSKDFRFKLYKPKNKNKKR